MKTLKPIIPHRSNPNGFSMIELVLVAVILGILMVLAWPMFTNMKEDRRDNREAVLTSVKSGINIYRANQEAQNLAIVYPNALDNVAVNTPCSKMNKCFSKVIPEPVTDSRWMKVNQNQYTWSVTPGGPVINTFTYNPQTGTFQ